MNEAELSPEDLVMVAADILRACEHLEYSQAQMMAAYKMCANVTETSMCTKVLIAGMSKLL